MASDLLPPWLRDTFTRLTSAFERGSLAHALLIHGPGGWGEVLLADRLALHIVGARADVPSAAELAHPDLRWIAPEKPGSQIRVDDVRALADFVVRTSTGGPNKAAVIADADAMNIAAANALLKTLEEPPPRTYLLLTATRPASLPPTIRSRCQLVGVPGRDTRDATDWLGERTASVEPGRRAALEFEYGGAPLEIVAALERDESGLEAQLAKALDPAAPILSVADVLAKDDTLSVVTRWMRYVPRELARRVRGASPDGKLATFLASVGAPQLHRFWNELLWARRLLVGTSNPNRRLLIEALLLEWRDLRHGTSH